MMIVEYKQTSFSSQKIQSLLSFPLPSLSLSNQVQFAIDERTLKEIKRLSVSFILPLKSPL